ncbi:MAG: hypothetical protein M1826_004668 [Phylliscum demangeonii]|nr:MAG: hypothetical protein M1826_004668 [Phylliscum demangeonii]
MAPATAHLDASAAALRKLYESGEFSDLLIRCDGQEFRVHRSIEARSGEIELDDDPSSISRMLTYLYTNDYEDVTAIEENAPDSPLEAIEPSSIIGVAQPGMHPASNSPISALKNNILVYAAAEKYDIPLLKDLAREKFIARAGDVWPLAGLPGVVRLVYAMTLDHDQGMRTVVAELCSQHLSALISTETFRSSVLELGSFGLDTLQACLAKHEAEKQDLLERLDREAKNAKRNLQTAIRIMSMNPKCSVCEGAGKPDFDAVGHAGMTMMSCTRCSYLWQQR